MLLLHSFIYIIAILAQKYMDCGGACKFTYKKSNMFIEMNAVKNRRSICEFFLTPDILFN